MIPFLFLALLLSSPAKAQTCGEDWSAYTSMKHIERVLLDSSSLWAATTGGVLRYDRLRGEYDRLTQIDGLAGNRILSLAADDEGNLWFGSHGQGLSRYRPATSTFDRVYQEFRGLAITSLLSEGTKLFVGTNSGVSLFLTDREEVKETYRLLGSLPKDTAALFMAVLDGTIFVGTKVGIAWAPIDHPNLQDPESWRSTARTGEVKGIVTVGGALYVATRQGVQVYDPEEDRFRGDYGGAVRSLGARGGQVVAATEEGRLLSRTEAERWEGLGAPPIKDITAISDTHEETLWLGTPSGLRVIGDPSVSQSSEPGSSQFYDIKVTGTGELWATSVPNDQHRAVSAGVYRLSEGRWSVFHRWNSMPNNEIVAVEIDARGRVWVGSWGGGGVIRDGDREWMAISTEETVLRGIPRNPEFVVISDIRRDAAGHMWLINTLVGVAVFDGYPPDREYLFDPKEFGLAPDLDLYRMDVGKDGLKWIVSRRSGLFVLDDGGTPFTGGDDRMAGLPPEQLSKLTSDRLFDLLVSRDGRIWLAAENGANVITPKYDRSTGTLSIATWQAYDTSDGLPSAEVNAFEEDVAGNIWVGTEAGLARIDDRGRVDLVLNRGNSCLISDRVKGLHYDSDRGDLWIGTLDGLSRLRLSTGEDGRDRETLSVYPNPYVRAGRQSLTFSGLPLGSTLRIYSASGDLVATRRGEAGRGTISWDGLNEAGYLVAAGVYYYVAESESGEPVSGRFALVKGARP